MIAGDVPQGCGKDSGSAISVVQEDRQRIGLMLIQQPVSFCSAGKREPMRKQVVDVNPIQMLQSYVFGA